MFRLRWHATRVNGATGRVKTKGWIAWLTFVFVLTASSLARAQCADDSECKGSRICHEGGCIEGCRADSDCAGEDVCTDRACRAPVVSSAPPAPIVPPAPAVVPAPPPTLAPAPPQPPPVNADWPPLEKHRPIWALVLGPIVMAGGAALLIGGIMVMSGVDDQKSEAELSPECGDDFFGERTVRCEFNDDEWEMGQGLAIAGAGFVGIGVAFTVFGALAVNREVAPESASMTPELRLSPLGAALRWRLQ